MTTQTKKLDYARPGVVAPPSTAIPKWHKWIPLILIAAGWLAYRNSFTGPFIFDDSMTIRENMKIRHLWPIWSAMWAPANASGASGRPVVQLSYCINYALGGLNVWGYHVVNLILHICVTLVAYGLIRRTLRSPRLAGYFSASDATVLAFVTTLLWEIHPLLTETITYISGRTEELLALFMLLTLYCLNRAATSARASLFWKIATVVSCVLGMSSKEVMVCAPLLALAYDAMFLSESFRETVRRRWGVYVALFLTWGVLLFNLTKADFNRSVLVGQERISSWDWLKTQSQVLTMYLRLAVWPDPLVIDYSGWSMRVKLIEALPYALLICALLGVTIYGLRRGNPAAFCGVWFFLILAPTSSFLPLPTEVATERRMYLPLLGIVALVTSAAWWGLREAVARRWFTELAARLSGTFAVLALSAACLHRTLYRNEDFKDTVTVWLDAVANRPANFRAMANLGVALQDVNRIEAAKECYQRAIAMNKTDYVSLNNLGTILFEEGDERGAIAAIMSALKLNPNHMLSYMNMSTIYLRQGYLDNAERCILEAIRLAPDRINLRLKLAAIRNAQGRRAEAEQICREALRADPRLLGARLELVNALEHTPGRDREALDELREAVRISGNAPDVAAQLAWRLALAPEGVRDISEATAIATRACDDSENESVVALDALAAAQAAGGDWDRAIATQHRAIERATQRKSSRLKFMQQRLTSYEAHHLPEGSLREFNAPPPTPPTTEPSSQPSP